MASGEFESTTENAALVDALRRRIEAEGPITFHDYMETVLYHPQHGYYASREPMGHQGDYLTSPEVHPMFGALAGKQLAQLWHVMGDPATFDIVEQGAGTGRLAHDLLRWASRRDPPFFAATRYRIVEISASLRERQQQTLRALPDLRDGQVEWLDALPDAIEGVVLTNELLDSFPVHRVTMGASPGPTDLSPNPFPTREGAPGLLEIYVTYANGRFVEELRAPSTPRIEQYFAEIGLLPSEGCSAEVNLHAVDWMASVAQRLRRGFVLTFDYGYEASELYAPWRREGTLMCFYRHNPSSDPYARIGKQDMTAHVDFTTLRRTGEQHRLETAGVTTQARFLSALGIGAALDEVAKEAPGALEEYYARRRAVQELIDPAGLGRIRALAQRKRVPEAPLLGFADGEG
jgi:SAM-dependent MidA family methyltransferase